MGGHYGIVHVLVVVLIFINLADCNHLQNVTLRRPQQNYSSRYTADELLMSQFDFKVSEDIDMDPCKSGMYEYNNLYLTIKCYLKRCTKRYSVYNTCHL